MCEKLMTVRSGLRFSRAIARLQDVRSKLTGHAPFPIRICGPDREHWSRTAVVPTVYGVVDRKVLFTVHSPFPIRLVSRIVLSPDPVALTRRGVRRGRTGSLGSGLRSRTHSPRRRTASRSRGSSGTRREPRREDPDAPARPPTRGVGFRLGVKGLFTGLPPFPIRRSGPEREHRCRWRETPAAQTVAYRKALLIAPCSFPIRLSFRLVLLRAASGRPVLRIDQAKSPNSR